MPVFTGLEPDTALVLLSLKSTKNHHFLPFLQYWCSKGCTISPKIGFGTPGMEHRFSWNPTNGYMVDGNGNNYNANEN